MTFRSNQYFEPGNERGHLHEADALLNFAIECEKAAIADMSLLQIAAFARSRQWNPAKA